MYEGLTIFRKSHYPGVPANIKKAYRIEKGFLPNKIDFENEISG